jgi:hypothetical protein
MKSAQTVPLPNGSKLPTASSSAESFWRNIHSSGRIFSPGWTHKSNSLLYQILVLTDTFITGDTMGDDAELS